MIAFGVLIHHTEGAISAPLGLCWAYKPFCWALHWVRAIQRSGTASPLTDHFFRAGGTSCVVGAVPAFHEKRCCCSIPLDHRCIPILGGASELHGLDHLLRNCSSIQSSKPSSSRRSPPIAPGGQQSPSCPPPTEMAFKPMINFYKKLMINFIKISD